MQSGVVNRKRKGWQIVHRLSEGPVVTFEVLRHVGVIAVELIGRLHITIVINICN